MAIGNWQNSSRGLERLGGSYKISYPEYVSVQAEKEAAAFAVKAALQRSTIFSSWMRDGNRAQSSISVGCRWPNTRLSWRKLEWRGLVWRGPWRIWPCWGVAASDQIAHCQLSLFFAHEFVSKDLSTIGVQAFHTNDWAIVLMP